MQTIAHYCAFLDDGVTADILALGFKIDRTTSFVLKPKEAIQVEIDPEGILFFDRATDLRLDII